MGNRRLTAIVIAFVLCFTLTPPAFASDASEGEGWGWLGTAGRWINLAVIAGLLFFALKKPLKGFFAQRRIAIQEEIEEAREAQALAESKLAEVEGRMKSLQSELKAIRESSQKESAAERQRLLREAEEDGRKIVASAQRDIENLKRQAREELKRYAASLAAELARDRISASLTEEDERRALERFVVQLAPGERGRSA